MSPRIAIYQFADRMCGGEIHLLNLRSGWRRRAECNIEHPCKRRIGVARERYGAQPAALAASTPFRMLGERPAFEIARNT